MTVCKVLLLGGVGSGKSSVARMLGERGADIVEADRIGHRVLEDPDVVTAVAAEWPTAVGHAGIDRPKLAAIVFNDVRELRKLEAITHPRIRSGIAERVESSTARVVVVEVPLLADLVEGDWFRVVVDAPDRTRVARLSARGLDEGDIRSRMDSQPAAAAYREVADLIIDNAGSLTELEVQVDELLDRLELHCIDSDNGFDSDTGLLVSDE